MGLEDLCSRLDDDGFTVDLAGDATRAGVTGKEALESELARDRVPFEVAFTVLTLAIQS